MGINLTFGNLYSILIWGEDLLMAFEILIPIAYVLLLSAFLLNFARFRYAIYIFLVLSFCVLSMFDVAIPYNAYYTLFGIAGLYTGLICREAGPILRSRGYKYGLLILLSSYLVLLIPCGANIRGNLILMFVYVNVVLGAVYLLGGYLDPSWIASRAVTKLGQYSLFLYLVQIFLLQMFYRLGIPTSESVTFQTWVVFVMITSLLIIVSYFSDYVRSRCWVTDRIYRIVFG
jgi:peptidoglycan/LPS O-acetylase OafA/YrhL